MAWKVEWTDPAVRMLKRIDHEAQRQIYRYLKTRIATIEDPRRFGKPLSGGMAGLWRYRVGDYRIICRIEDHRLVVLVVTLGHRKHVYQ